jgi:hypothetical protein
MSTPLLAILIGVVIMAFVVGGLLKFRNSARRGMPSQDVLKRATERARELDAADQRRDEARSGDF